MSPFFQSSSRLRLQYVANPLRRAFTYDWRLWSLPELREVLAEAGFERIEVLWDVAPGAAETEYVPRRAAAAQAGWLAYVVGRKPRA